MLQLPEAATRKGCMSSSRFFQPPGIVGSTAPRSSGASPRRTPDNQGRQPPKRLHSLTRSITLRTTSTGAAVKAMQRGEFSCISRHGRHSLSCKSLSQTVFFELAPLLIIEGFRSASPCLSWSPSTYRATISSPGLFHVDHLAPRYHLHHEKCPT